MLKKSMKKNLLKKYPEIKEIKVPPFTVDCICQRYEPTGACVGALPPCKCEVEIHQAVIDSLLGFAISEMMKEAVANDVRKKVAFILKKRRKG